LHVKRHRLAEAAAASSSQRRRSDIPASVRSMRVKLASGNRESHPQIAA